MDSFPNLKCGDKETKRKCIYVGFKRIHRTESVSCIKLLREKKSRAEGSGLKLAVLLFLCSLPACPRRTVSCFGRGVGGIAPPPLHTGCLLGEMAAGRSSKEPFYLPRV
jgi:hypothetical protein